MKTFLALSSFFILFVASASQHSDSNLTAEVSAVDSDVEKPYLDLHQTPELSTLEKNTSAEMGAALRTAGYSVTTNVGGYGVAGVLRNGPGPVVMLRTDIDALPVEEQTGLNEVKGDKTKLPSLHSALFASDREPTLKTTIVSEVAVLRELLKKKS